ncbi:hypothetical protein [[Mycobacterium] nativiensis]|uniref:Uncharacterized protein n=1 Tax=[Mycobacterium] nativiensis TaxID=2855503 RepID=A0ABU5XV09_9MYCO|nr:hypothetical protein [Mycolicibacter sp. MYC340]MEB3031773.1 hypothetical protein [Mycolicibacter sp. MYC340]
MDPDLDSVLVEHGWILFDREGLCDIYDWPPSETGAAGAITYLMVAQPAPPLRRCPYRVCLVDGERLMYSTFDALLADLAAIETYRFQSDPTNRHRALSVFTHAALR